MRATQSTPTRARGRGAEVLPWKRRARGGPGASSPMLPASRRRHIDEVDSAQGVVGTAIAELRDIEHRRIQ